MQSIGQQQVASDVVWSAALQWVAALWLGAVVTSLLLPAVVLHPVPPICVSTFGYTVPCGLAGFEFSTAFAVGGTTAIATRIALARLGRGH